MRHENLRAPKREPKSSGYVEIRIDDVTVENLRKFGKLLNDMADKLEASHAA